MGITYHQLNEKTNDIRLLTLLPISRRAGVVHCTLTTHSLEHLSQDYLEFLDRAIISARTGREIISRWTEQRTASEWAYLAPLHRVNGTRPPPYLHRFAWGDYAALSYAWGDECVTSTIIVNGKPTTVTSNLASALKQFSNESEFEDGFKLWVDAICINQADLAERARQIQRMREIYGSAWVVIAWLGEEDKQSNSAIQLIQDLAVFSQAKYPEFMEKHLQMEPQFLGKGCWLALEELMEPPYWYRLWIIQEMVMGASATWIRCGSAYIDWSTFCKGIAFLQEHLWLVKDHLLRREAMETAHGKIVWSTTSLHLVHQDLSLLSRREEKGGAWPSFGRLLDIANCGGCRDPRDKVYALVGLMSPPVQALLIPDYTADTFEIYSTTARIFIQAYNSLEPLREGNPWGPTNTPSWAADWQWPGRLRWSRTENRLWLPAYLFPQTDSYESSYAPYRASGVSKGDAVFESSGLLLSCTGFILDSISGLAARGKGYFNWDRSSIVQPRGWKSSYGSFEQTSEALWRTMIMDRVEGGKKASPRHAVILHLPSTFKKAGKQFVLRDWAWLAGLEGYYFRWEKFRVTNQRFRIGEYLLGDFFTDEIPADASEYDMTEVHGAYERSSQKRRFMTTTNGYIGWAPDNIFGSEYEQTKLGDLIAIVFGCTTPIAIRPMGSHFQVLGEAYVQGFMDGEAMELLKSGKVQTRRFTFC